MNAKDFLSRAYYLEQQILSKQQQIAALRSLAEKVTQTFGGEPVDHTRNVTAIQDTVEKILEAEAELNRQIDELVDTKLKVGQVIDQVENIRYRLILEKRYLAFMPWVDIAAECGYSARWLQVKHLDALDAVQQILDGYSESSPSYVDGV